MEFLCLKNVVRVTPGTNVEAIAVKVTCCAQLLFTVISVLEV